MTRPSPQTVDAPEAVVLVGGQGTRLRPLTETTPKPMLPTAGVPFLTHLLSRARAAGIGHVVLSTSYKAEVFREHFGDGAALGLELEYVTEEEPLGTGGGIRNVLDRLRGGDVVVFNGDVLSGLDIPALVARHRETEAAVTLHLTRVEDPRAFGLVPTDADGRVRAFLEKPQTPEEIVTDQVNAGCYVFRPEVLAAIPAGRPVSVERETFPGLLAAGERLTGFVDDTYWLDLGTPAAFVRGSCDLVLGVAPTAALPGEPGEALLLPGAVVHPDAVVSGGTAVGAGASVAAGAVVHASVVLEGAQVAASAEVRHSVVGADAVVGEGVVLDGVVVGDGARVGAGCELRAGARVWTGAELPPRSVRWSA